MGGGRGGGQSRGEEHERRTSKRSTKADMTRVDGKVEQRGRAERGSTRRSSRSSESKVSVTPPFMPAGNRWTLQSAADTGSDAEAAISKRLSFGDFEPFQWEHGSLPEPDFLEFGQSIRACVREIGRWCQLMPDSWQTSQASRRPYDRLRVIDGFPAGDVPPPWDSLVQTKRCTDWPPGKPNTERMTNDVAEELKHLGDRTELVYGHDVDERPRWGIDNHTRRCIEAVMRHVPTLAFDRDRRRRMIDFGLLKAANEMHDHNWDMREVVNFWQSHAEDERDRETLHACDAMNAAMDEVEAINFRLHPKGYGIVCTREGGLPPHTFISDYLGELYPPWRFHERQDAWKKLDPSSNLPDIYNITLDRPRTETHGYDVLFVEASNKAGFASRLSHSCEPNCHVICQSDGEKLTLAMYTNRHVREGEELCWDYALVTENQRELSNATCLCSAEQCRGVYVLYAGDSRLNFFFNENHTFTTRNALLCRACNEQMTDEDRQRLDRCGVRECMLHDVHGERVPEWLEKWISLVLQFAELESDALIQKLKDTSFTGVSQERIDQLANFEAKGLFDSRMFHLACSLDKVRYFMNASASSGDSTGRCKPFEELSSRQVADYLFNNQDSLAKALLRNASQCIAPDCQGREKVNAKLLERKPDFDKLSSLLDFFHNLPLAETRERAQENLKQLSRKLRALGSEHIAAADFAFLYSKTNRLFRSKEYRSFKSRPVDFDTFKDDRVKQSKRSSKKNNEDIYSKHYGKFFVWAQLSHWYKQTRYNVQQQLLNSVREVLCLPDAEVAYIQSRNNYENKMRPRLMHSLSTELQLPPEMTFANMLTNASNIFGSPIFDAALAFEEKMMSATVEESMRRLVKELDEEYLHPAVAHIPSSDEPYSTAEAKTVNNEQPQEETTEFHDSQQHQQRQPARDGQQRSEKKDRKRKREQVGVADSVNGAYAEAISPSANERAVTAAPVDELSERNLGADQDAEPVQSAKDHKEKFFNPCDEHNDPPRANDVREQRGADGATEQSSLVR